MDCGASRILVIVAACDAERRERSRPAGYVRVMVRVHSGVKRPDAVRKGDEQVTRATQKPAFYRYFVLATSALSRRRSRVRVPSLPLRRAPQYAAFARVGRE